MSDPARPGETGPTEGQAQVGPTEDPGQVGPTVRLCDLRVVVDRVEGRSVCGLQPGDAFVVTDSSRLSIENGGHFCLYALAAVLPLLPANQRPLPVGDWLHGDVEVACPDPEERLIMRIERGDVQELARDELT